jgi:hypothetical protein
VDLSSAISVNISRAGTPELSSTTASPVATGTVPILDRIMAAMPEPEAAPNVAPEDAILNEIEAVDLTSFAAAPAPQLNIATLNRAFDTVELTAFAQASAASTLTMSLNLSGNEVSTEVLRSASSYALLVLALDQSTLSNAALTDDPDTVIATANQISGANNTIAIAMIAGVGRCTVTGNSVLNRATGGSPLFSLGLFPKAVPSSRDGSAVAAVAVTGNVFRGTPILPIRKLSPTPPAPMNTWDFFNSET